MSVTSMSVKGQIVIPKEIREALGIKPGKRFMVTVRGKAIVLEPMEERLGDDLWGILEGSDLLSDLEAEHTKEVESERAHAGRKNSPG